jgi:hypothetical protein
MEAVSTSEMPVKQTTPHNITQDSGIHTRRRENVKCLTQFTAHLVKYVTVYGMVCCNTASERTCSDSLHVNIKTRTPTYGVKKSIFSPVRS